MRLARIFGLVGAAVLLAATTLAAAPPAVPEEQKAAPGQPLVFVVKGADLGYKPAFTARDGIFVQVVPEGGPKMGEATFLFVAGTPGKYPVVFWSKGDITGVLTTITVEGKQIVVDPKDKKTSDKKAARLVVITDAGNRDASRLVAKYQMSAAFNEYYKEKAFLRWGAVDKDAVGPDRKPLTAADPHYKLIQAAKEKKYPQYFVVDAEWGVVEQGDLPDDPATMIATLQRLGGK
jgi:hypothetical protein